MDVGLVDRVGRCFGVGMGVWGVSCYLREGVFDVLGVLRLLRVRGDVRLRCYPRMWVGVRGVGELGGCLGAVGELGLEDCVDVLCAGVDVPLGWRARLGRVVGGIRAGGVGVRFDRVRRVYVLEGAGK